MSPRRSWWWLQVNRENGAVVVVEQRVRAAKSEQPRKTKAGHTWWRRAQQNAEVNYRKAKVENPEDQNGGAAK